MEDNFRNDALWILNKELVRLRNLSEAVGLSSDDANTLKTLVDTYVRLQTVKGKGKAADKLITFKRVTDGSLIKQLKRKERTIDMDSEDDEEGQE
jgi:hypothetical protein